MSDIQWDAAAQRFRGPGGKFIAEQAIRGAVDDLVSASSDRVAALTERLASGMPLGDWQNAMRAEIKSLHMVTATIAHGGKAQMAAADYGWVSGQLRFQYDRLNVFALDIAQGRETLTHAPSRARLYAEAGRLTFQEMGHRDGRVRGATEERWVRRASESCPGCVAQSGRGWVPVGQLPRLGGQPCRSRCRCVIQTRTVAREAA